jgi:peptidoglycan/xylan/chitin deacetylase (PgdA/CDA1 family)
MITFDDGYRSCHDVALPILRRLGVPATFFIATSFVAERRLYWWERIAVALGQAKVKTTVLAYPKPLDVDVRDPDLRAKLNDLIKNTPGLDVDRFVDELFAALGVDWDHSLETAYADGLIMTWDQIRALARAGMDVESHTRRHRVLQTLSDDALRDELAGSRDDLEAQLGRPIRAVAYPVGRRVAHNARIREALRAAGYMVGLSNASGVNRLWPNVLRGVLPVDRFDVRRLSTDRALSDAMFLTQVALPALAYGGRHDS